MDGLGLTIFNVEMPDIFGYSYDGTTFRMHEKFSDDDQETINATAELLKKQFPSDRVSVEGNLIILEAALSVEGAVGATMVEMLNQAFVRDLISGSTLATVIGELIERSKPRKAFSACQTGHLNSKKGV